MPAGFLLDSWVNPPVALWVNAVIRCTAVKNVAVNSEAPYIMHGAMEIAQNHHRVGLVLGLELLKILQYKY